MRDSLSIRTMGLRGSMHGAPMVRAAGGLPLDQSALVRKLGRLSWCHFPRKGKRTRSTADQPTRSEQRRSSECLGVHCCPRRCLARSTHIVRPFTTLIQKRVLYALPLPVLLEQIVECLDRQGV